MEVAATKEKGNNQLEEQQHEWRHGGIVAAGSRQCKVEVAAKKETIKWRSSIVSGGMAATAMQHCHSRQWPVQSLEVAAKKKKGNN